MSDVQIRWMIRADLPAVLAIENRCFPYPWTEDELRGCLRQRNVIGMVADVDGRVVGFMVYEIHKQLIQLMNLAVDPSCSGIGIGRAMVEKLMSKLTPDRRNRITLAVRASNLNAQLFFRALGFRCINIVNEYYEYCDEEAYIFQRRYEQPANAVA